MPLVRGHIAMALAPGLLFHTFGRFREKPEKYRKLMKVQDSKRAYEEATAITGLGPLYPKGELEPPVLDYPIQHGLVRWIHETFSLAVAYSKEARDDDQYGIIMELAGQLGKSSRYTVELWAHDVFNLGFVTTRYTGMDGKALFATDHPVLGVPGKTVANRPTGGADADLSVTGIEAAIQAFELQVDDRDMFIDSQPTLLFFHPSNRMNAKRLLQSAQMPNSQLNDINTIKDENLEPFSTPYLTDPDMWGLLGQTADLGIKFFWREMPDTATWDDESGDATFHKIRQRHSVGFDEWRHTWASPGA